MKLSVISNSSIPAYKQLYDCVTSQILSGELKSGTPLPPIRTVSREIGVSVITVRNAWDALEADGYITTKAGSGCFIADLSEPDRKKRLSETISIPLNTLIEAARSLGLSEDDLIKLTRNAYKRSIN